MNRQTVQVYSGIARKWTFVLSLASLKDGENIIIVEVTYTYNFKSSRTIKLNKHANHTPLKQSTHRYKITPPSGSAKSVLLRIQKDADQEVTAEIPMTTGTEQEQFVPLLLENISSRHTWPTRTCISGIIGRNRLNDFAVGAGCSWTTGTNCDDTS